MNDNAAVPDMNVFVRPRRDESGRPMVVPDPQTFRPLAADGEWKSLAHIYWARRLAAGDVEPCEVSPHPDPLPLPREREKSASGEAGARP